MGVTCKMQMNKRRLFHFFPTWSEKHFVFLDNLLRNCIFSLLSSKNISRVFVNFVKHLSNLKFTNQNYCCIKHQIKIINFFTYSLIWKFLLVGKKNQRFDDVTWINNGEHFSTDQTIHQITDKVDSRLIDSKKKIPHNRNSAFSFAVFCWIKICRKTLVSQGKVLFDIGNSNFPFRDLISCKWIIPYQNPQDNPATHWSTPANGLRITARIK